MIFPLPLRPKLRVLHDAAIGAGEVIADFISVARDSILAFNNLHRKTRSIQVGDMVIIRMGDVKRGTQELVGRSGMVIYKSNNPVFCRYNVLIDSRRISLDIQEIEKC